MEELDGRWQELLRSQGELVGSISHELKGMISGIDGGLYLVDSGFKKGKPDRVDQGFEMVRRNLDRIRRTVTSTLYYVKDRAVNWGPVELDGVVSAVSRALADRAAHLGVTLEALPASGTCEGDPLAVQSMLLNMVEFALETCHTSKVSGAPSVRFTAALEGGDAVLDVVAEGAVVKEETREKALASCYAPIGVDRSHLGLFIVHRLLRNHGGTLEIETAPEAGRARILGRIPARKPPE